jgi:hypothetical protein
MDGWSSKLKDFDFDFDFDFEGSAGCGSEPVLFPCCLRFPLFRFLSFVTAALLL